MVAKKAGMSRKWRRMGAFQDEVASFVDKVGLSASVAAPENKNEVRASLVEIFDDGFGKSFPTFAAVRAGVTGLNREDVIEKQNALFLPTGQIAG